MHIHIALRQRRLGGRLTEDVASWRVQYELRGCQVDGRNLLRQRHELNLGAPVADLHLAH